MKLKKLIYSIPLAVILVAVGTGCRKSQFNINRNVNDPTDSTVTYDVVLPAALHASGFKWPAPVVGVLFRIGWAFGQGLVPMHQML